jgi:hypothetical protein
MVSLEVLARMADGRELAIAAEIAAPERQPDGSSICRVSIAPLEAQALDVRGVDSFHAVWLACGLVLKLLSSLKSAGAVLLTADGTAFPLELYLAGLGESEKNSG